VAENYGTFIKQNCQWLETGGLFQLRLKPEEVAEWFKEYVKIPHSLKGGEKDAAERVGYRRWDEMVEILRETNYSHLQEFLNGLNMSNAPEK